MHAKRAFLLGVVAALSFAALLGIWVLLFRTFFDLEWRIFATLGSIVLFCLPSLAASAMLEKRHWVVVNIAALVMSITGLLFYALAIWLPNALLWRPPQEQFTWKLMAFQATWAIALPWTALLGRTRFDDWFRWLRWGAITVVPATAGLITVAFIMETDTEVMWKSLGVLGILTGLATISLPILYKVRGIEQVAGVESTPLTMKITCPRCMMEQTVVAGSSRCQRCRLKFDIQIEEPRCPKCRYLLHNLTRPICPECGTSLADEEVGQTQTPPSADAVIQSG